MANKDHLQMLEKGVDVWNRWRQDDSSHMPDLRGADLRGVDLTRVDLRGANLSKVDLSEANLTYADLRGVKLTEANLTRAKLIEAELNKADLNEANLTYADLRGAKLTEANLSGVNLTCAYLHKANLSEANFKYANLSKADLNEADLTRAKLRHANLSEANLSKVDLTEANLAEANLYGADLNEAELTRADISGANLTKANLTKADINGARIIGAKLNGAILTGCRVFGIAAWENTGLEEAEQSNLVITPYPEPVITVDNLEVAQFIYILLHSEKIRSVIDTITSKVVLILGRFTPERKAILDVIRVELRKRNYLPILFDFEKPAGKSLTETVSTLAHMARFVIADITDARSIPQELQTIVPNLPSVPVQPILDSSATEYGMFEHFKRYPWVLETHRYNDIDDLLKCLGEKIIAPAEDKVKDLQKR